MISIIGLAGSKEIFITNKAQKSILQIVMKFVNFCSIKNMKIGIITYGCAVNHADSETLASLLKSAGYVVAFENEEPDLLIVNTCIVKGPTENKIIRKLQDFEKNGKDVIVTGCMPQAYPKIAERFPRFRFIGTDPLNIFELLEEQKHTPLKKVRRNRYVEILPISQGCLGSCTYCATKLARGNLKSEQPEKLVGNVKKAVDEGVKEVWLTAQDTGCYGFDINTDLASLLKRILDEVGGEYRIRVGMMNPEHLKRIIDDLLDVYDDERIYKFLHLPLQSGSDRILRSMNRKYISKEFEAIVKKFRERMDITLATDIIVGFPGESARDFESTLDVIRKTKPEVMNLSRYWPRKDTLASKLKQLQVEIIKERGKVISEEFEKLSKNPTEKGTGAARLLVTERRDNGYIGRNIQYRPIVVKTNLDVEGSFINAKVSLENGKLVCYV